MAHKSLFHLDYITMTATISNAQTYSSWIHYTIRSPTVWVGTMARVVAPFNFIVIRTMVVEQMCYTVAILYRIHIRCTCGLMFIISNSSIFIVFIANKSLKYFMFHHEILTHWLTIVKFDYLSLYRETPFIKKLGEHYMCTVAYSSPPLDNEVSHILLLSYF